MDLKIKDNRAYLLLHFFPPYAYIMGNVLVGLGKKNIVNEGEILQGKTNLPRP